MCISVWSSDVCSSDLISGKCGRVDASNARYLQGYSMNVHLPHGHSVVVRGDLSAATTLSVRLHGCSLMPCETCSNNAESDDYVVLWNISASSSIESVSNPRREMAAETMWMQHSAHWYSSGPDCADISSEERRVGTECVSTCRSV